MNLRGLSTLSNPPPAQISHVEPLQLPENVIKALSIDNLIFGLDNDELKVLLVKHSEPFLSDTWALPGGWIRYDENLRDAAERLLKEWTGLGGLFLSNLSPLAELIDFPTSG